MTGRGGRLRKEIAGLRGGAGAGRATAIGLGATVLWLLMVLLFWWLAPGDGAEGGGGVRLATLVGVLMPVALIWLAVGTARALAGLRDEAEALRAELLRMRRAAPAGAAEEAGPLPLAAFPAMPAATPPRPQPQERAAPAAARAPASRLMPARPAARRAEAPQPSLDLGTPAAVEVLPGDLIAALNFPDGPDDHAAVAALRHALTDPETARLIRAAQDAVTLLAARGFYMDDQPPPAVPAETWRRFAEGVRGEPVAGIGAGGDAAEAAALAESLRGDVVFRDAAHHFLRHWDRMLGSRLPGLSDDEAVRLAATRSGRAFVALARATGIVG